MNKCQFLIFRKKTKFKLLYRIFFPLTKSIASYLTYFDLYYQVQLNLLCPLLAFAVGFQCFVFFLCPYTICFDWSFSITLQMSTRLRLIQETQSASPVHHLQPISELACIPHPHDGALSESSVGPTRACQPAQCRFYSLLKNSAFLKQNSWKKFWFFLFFKVKSLRLSYILLPLPWPKCQRFPLLLAFLYLFLFSLNVKMPLCL